MRLFQRGFGLIELIVYISLVSLLLLHGLVSTLSLSKISTETEQKINKKDEEAELIETLRRIIENNKIIIPKPNETANYMILQNYEGKWQTYSISNFSLEQTDITGKINLLHNNDIRIKNFQVKNNESGNQLDLSININEKEYNIKIFKSH